MTTLLALRMGESEDAAKIVLDIAGAVSDGTLGSVAAAARNNAPSTVAGTL